MIEKNAHIYELLIREHLGNATPEEKKEIALAMEEDDFFREMAAKVQSIPREEAAAYISNTNLRESMEQVFAKREERTRKTTGRILKWAVSVAAIVIFATGLWIYYKPVTDKQDIAVNDKANQTTTGITLTLANGTTVAIHETGGQTIHADKVTLVNNNRQLSFKESGPAPEGWNTLILPARLDYSLELADGTIVRLNSLTKFRFPFSFTGNRREVFLESGEAYFDVAHNPGKPFIVHTNNGDVEVLGTQFNINDYSSQQTVTSLVSGKVRILYSGVERILEPGKQAQAGNRTIHTAGFSDETTSWLSGHYYFKDATVQQITELIERWYGTKVVISNPGAVKDIRIRALLDKNQPLQSFLDFMNSTTSIKFYRKGDILYCE